MFSTLNDKITNGNITVYIRNLEISMQERHWYSSKYIAKLADDFESIFLKFKDLDQAEKELIHLLLGVNKQNQRIQSLNFFTDDAYKQTLVCVCVSDINTFKPDNWLERNIIINFKKANKVLWITDVTKEEWLNRERKLPIGWKPKEQLNNKYSKYKQLFL